MTTNIKDKMKEVAMEIGQAETYRALKCPMCDGTGKCYEQTIRYQEIETNRTELHLAKCKKCNGSGEVLMTNEEWFCSLSTENKAKVLACEFIVACDEYAYFHNKETWNEKYWVEWLKEIHHG